MGGRREAPAGRCYAGWVRPLTAALLAALALLAACSRPPTLALEGDEAPPRFRLGGSAKQWGLLVSTSLVPRPKEGVRNRVLWHVVPETAGSTPADAPVVTYGVLPPGYRAIRFDAQSTKPLDAPAPEALVEGVVYAATLSTSTPNFVSTSYRDATVCFRVEAGRVVGAPCPAE